MSAISDCFPTFFQGQTRYHCLVFSFKEEEEEDLEIPLTEEEIKEKYEGKLEKNMSGPSYEVVSTLFRAVTGRKITQPKDFLGHSGTPAITCSHKAASGNFFAVCLLGGKVSQTRNHVPNCFVVQPSSKRGAIFARSVSLDLVDRLYK